MMDYEEYMQSHPKVARSRAEKLINDRDCIFIQGTGTQPDLAVLPERGFASRPVVVDLQNLTCQCNVYQTKRACPHVAAALGLIERNGGTVPYTDLFEHVCSCLEALKKGSSGPIMFGNSSDDFYANVSIPLKRLSDTEKARFLMLLSYELQRPGTRLTERTFYNCYRDMDNMFGKTIRIVDQLFQNRHDCMNAVVRLMKDSFGNPFSKEETEVILNEIVSDDELAAKYISSLAPMYSANFSLKQLLPFLRNHGSEHLPGYVFTEIMNRLLNADPPLYGEYLDIYNVSSDSFLSPPDLAHVENMIRAGYGEKMKKLIILLIRNMKEPDDYTGLRKVIPQDLFLTAWKDRENETRYSWNRVPEEIETLVNICEDPETNLDEYQMDDLSLASLETIRRTRPEYVREVNQAARKIYRRALKDGNQRQAREALLLLARGDDNIAVKYASEWSITGPDDLVCVTAVGVHFDSLQKLVPELRNMEVRHATGQD